MKSPRFSRVALVGRTQTEGVAQTIAEIAAFLTGQAHQVLIETSTARGANA